MLIAMCAGELSGDTLGADYIPVLKKQYPNATFVGIGGPKMIKAGLKPWFDMETLSVMGIGEVLANLTAILKLRKNFYQKLLAEKVDMYVGIDAPDFNLPMELKLKANGVHTVHYVSPTIWAWRPGRIHKIIKATDKVLCLFPFEVDIYKKAGHEAEFVGHPLAKQIPLKVDKSAAKKKLGLSGDDTVIALLPGSRSQEVKRILPLILNIVSEFLSLVCFDPIGFNSQNAVNPSVGARSRTSCSPPFEIKTNRTHAKESPSQCVRFVIPVAKSSLKPLFNVYKDQLKQLGVELMDGKAGEVLAASDAAVITSGTATLEAMLYKVPSVVVYKTGLLTYLIGKMMVKLNFIALPNILAGKCLMPEFIQGKAVPKDIAEALIEQLEAGDGVKAEFIEIHQGLRIIS